MRSRRGEPRHEVPVSRPRSPPTRVVGAGRHDLRAAVDATVPITEVHWRGGYQYTGYGLVTGFTITFYATNITGAEPDCGILGDNDHYLARYVIAGTAGQTPAGTYGVVVMYDYQVALAQPFQATAGVLYWIQIEGDVSGLPFWGVSQGLGGNGSHFRYVGSMFNFWPHDAAFSLFTTADPTFAITTAAAPPQGGATTGDGAYPSGSQATWWPRPLPAGAS